MPTVEENKKTWDDGIYKWSFQGDEWSAAWGNPSMQWYGTILPRIHRFLPTDSILEIACGYGRWTQFLKNLCHHLEVIELSDECIQACKKRFSESIHIKYHLNDGKSLDMISDNSINFVFSFDSLVHADETVMNAYISQLPRILKEDGVAFIHHSNLGEYSHAYSRIRKIPRLENLLTRLGILEKTLHWREFGVSAKLVEALAKAQGLKCISQEVLNWGTKRTQIDCFSTIVKETSSLARENRFYRNSNFMQEVSNLSLISSLYSKK
jgi:ubiquinone/menaquinone biosynthesis C-methylase UbiE